MAAPTTRRISSLFFLLCVSSVQISGESSIQKGVSAFEEVDDLTLDAVAQTHEHVLAFFHDGSCSSHVCKKALEELELVQSDNQLPALKIVSIHSDAKAKELGIHDIPNLIFFHNGSPNLYPGHEIEVEAVMEWIEGSPDELIQPLDDTNFEHLTQAATGATTGDWLVIFHKSTCSSVLPTLRAVANRLRNRVVVARVDMTHSPELVKRFKITNCPTLKFFRLGNMYDFHLPKYDLQTIVKFAEGWYKNSRASKVPAELSPFDHLVESIALSLKDAVEQKQVLPLAVGGGVVILIFILVCACCTISGSREKKD